MGEETDTIKQHIEVKRAELGEDVDELASRLKRMTDWRTLLREHWRTILGASFVAGLLLSLRRRR